MCSVKRLLGGLVVAVVLLAFSRPASADDKPAKSKKAETPEQAIEFLAAASKAGDLAAALDQIAPPFHDIMRLFILHEEAYEVLTAALDQKFGKEPRKGFGMGVKYDLLRIQKIEILAKDKGDGARVKFSVRETLKSFHHDGSDILETSYLAVKEGDGWKVLRPFTALIFDASKEDMTEESTSKKGPDGKEIGVFKITFKKDLDEVGRKLRTSIETREEAKLPELLVQAKREKAIAEKVAADVKGGVYKTRKEATDAKEAALRQADKKNP
jgi:hypothetical protein